MPELKNIITSVFLLFAGMSTLLAQRADHALAEDDHIHKFPLKNALELNFAGITATVNLKKDGSLVCGSKTLKELYLDPLKARASAGGGTIYEGYKDEFIVVLEIRSDEEPTLKALENELINYHDILTEKTPSGINIKAVRIIAASRNGKAFEYNHKSSFIFSEIPFNEVPEGSSSDFEGLCGLDFRKIYDWSGLGAMPNMQFHSFSSGLKVNSKKGYKARIYNFPEVPGAMDLFLNAGAAYLQIKDREAFIKYLRNK